MQDYVMVTGMVLKTVPVGEYDRHVCILTKERGKITAYAKGARKPNSRLVAATNPFSFGEFKLFAGKNSYNLVDTSITNYFDGLRTDFEAAYFGIYFLELADYYTRENNDERETLMLLYQTLRALCSDKIPNKLIRCIYEMKLLSVNGEFPGIPKDENLLESTCYTINFIVQTPIERLYTFLVNDEVLSEMQRISGHYIRLVIDRPMKSLEMLDVLDKKG